jgi:phosphate starvation-inducible PhoH-like protein
MQLKMFLTRMGPSAKCIITGDLSQIDLPYHQKSGLQRSINLLKNLEGVSTIYLDAEDVVRHRLVKEIIKAYERADEAARKRFEEEEDEMHRRRSLRNGSVPPEEQSSLAGLDNAEEAQPAEIL